MDFTSALYLGLTHPSETLSWKELTTGTPACLRMPDEATAAERAFAALAGSERAQLFTSTLHAFSDLFAQIGKRGCAVLYDEGLYPIARWGMDRAERRGARASSFAHHDPESLRARLRGLPPSTSARWVVTDGFCTGCTRPAPLADYADVARQYGARLLIDDTQAVGLYGASPSRAAPYGHGGGGSMRRFALEGKGVITVASLAKAFGAPLTMVAGPAAFMSSFAAESETLVHCSPPSAPSVGAALAALSWNAISGDGARARLAASVASLRRAFASRGFSSLGGVFPMQRVVMPNLAAATAIAKELARRNVHAVVQRLRCTQRVALTFIVTLRHRPADFERAAVALSAAARCFRGSLVDARSHMEA